MGELYTSSYFQTIISGETKHYMYLSKYTNKKTPPQFSIYFTFIHDLFPFHIILLLWSCWPLCCKNKTSVIICNKVFPSASETPWAFLSLTIYEWVFKQMEVLSIYPPPGAPGEWTTVEWDYLKEFWSHNRLDMWTFIQWEVTWATDFVIVYYWFILISQNNCFLV